MKSEENIFLLSKETNYNSRIISTTGDIFKAYSNLMNFYTSYSIETMNIKDKSIFYTGLNTIHHIFRLLYLYTKNLELTVHNTQQSIYYFVEYISQITDREDNIFFNLSIKDAVIYVYTRSIFEIRKQYIKKTHAEDDQTLQYITLITNKYENLIYSAAKFLFDESSETVKKNLVSLYEKFILIEHCDTQHIETCQARNYDDVLKALDLHN